MNTTEWNFDGRGINGGGEYRDRIATLTEHGHALKAGLIMAAAPELAEALRELLCCSDLGLDELEPDTRAAIERAQDALNKAGVTL